jgi:hypothetical protein
MDFNSLMMQNSAQKQQALRIFIHSIAIKTKHVISIS